MIIAASSRRLLPLIALACCSTAGAAATPDFGPNVIVFAPSSDKAKMEQQVNDIFTKQRVNQFGPERYAVFFKPGAYDLDVNVGFYTQIAGLGKSPDDVVINGQVHAEAWEPNANVTQNFWRSCENLSMTPKKSARWAVSQAAPMRRVHVRGDLSLFVGGWASGGFLANSKIDGKVVSGSQQQWISRNTEWGSWNGGVWNMFFLGVTNPPSGNWPARPFTVVADTPLIREKPFLTIDASGAYAVFVGDTKKDSKGVDWANGNPPGTSIPIDKFYIAQSSKDTASTINAALAQGKNLLLTPGVYHVQEPIKITRPGTIVLGLGFASLVAEKGTIAMQVDDVDGVKIAGLLFDAGKVESPTLLQIGEKGSVKRHTADPIYLYDIFARIGGAGAATADTAVVVNSSDVIGDHFWIWRADHGDGAGWDSNKSRNGVVVNGSDVSFYGLFVEHFQEYQTVWKGENGRLYFYQCELPYDPPSNDQWQHNGVKGYAGYKVADSVKNHQAYAMGLYSFFNKAPIICDNAVEAPTAPNVKFTNVMTFWLNGNPDSVVKSVVNNAGAAVNKSNRKSMLTDYPLPGS